MVDEAFVDQLRLAACLHGAFRVEFAALEASLELHRAAATLALHVLPHIQREAALRLAVLVARGHTGALFERMLPPVHHPRLHVGQRREHLDRALALDAHGRLEHDGGAFASGAHEPP